MHLGNGHHSCLTNAKGGQCNGYSHLSSILVMDIVLAQREFSIIWQRSQNEDVFQAFTIYYVSHLTLCLLAVILSSVDDLCYIGPNRTSGLIWAQAVWCSRVISERIFLKKVMSKNICRHQKNHEKLASMQKKLKKPSFCNEQELRVQTNSLRSTIILLFHLEISSICFDAYPHHMGQHSRPVSRRMKIQISPLLNRLFLDHDIIFYF